MKTFRLVPLLLAGVAPALLPVDTFAQATISDYQRSMGLRDKYADLVTGTADAPRWIEQTNRFYYRRTVKGGHEWMLVDGTSHAKSPAFDHEKLAAGISTAASRKATAVSLPFTNFTFVDNGRAIEFTLSTGTGGGAATPAGRGGPATDVPPWRCSLDNYSCRQQEPRAGRGGAGRGGRGGGGLAGHQVFRVIEIDGITAKARAIIGEEPKTFFTYSSKKFRQDIEETNEVIWMSERDGWNHLYLYDSRTGAVKNQITKGEWPVRAVVSVDEKSRQVYFSASGMYAGKDPYFLHYYRINFDGTGLTTLTPTEGNHSASFSPDRSVLVDTYSRVDMAPVTELRSARDGALLATLETGDATALKAAGWKAPEVFSAKGRDGKTDIWGLIYRPSNFDPKKKYPVVENIYAGPHSSHVPKNFGAYNQMQAQAEVGFIVVQIDGMGTSNRSKAFHDVAWQNLKDAGFPDRIAWHQAAAAKYPSHDLGRVGIYGTSAGGQNSLGALLFHPEFYKAAVSAAGCHDNRMDKIWWNEQWMGTLGEHYADSSNVVHASKLQGKLMLVVGEMDNNVDPASTYQVVDQLIKNNKEFDLLVIPGALHTNGGAYGEHKRNDFFARHLLGVTPPEWKAIEDATKKSTTTAAVR